MCTFRRDLREYVVIFLYQFSHFGQNLIILDFAKTLIDYSRCNIAYNLCNFFWCQLLGTTVHQVEKITLSMRSDECQKKIRHYDLISLNKFLANESPVVPTLFMYSLGDKLIESQHIEHYKSCLKNRCV